jgi:hypothetical protein
MAANDVQINIIGKDQATGAFQSVLQSAEKTSRGVQGLGTGVGSLNTSFKGAQSSALSFDAVLASAGGYAMAIAGVQGLGEALHATVGEAIDFYTTMQTGSISLAGSLISMGQLNGQDLTWNQSLLMSKKLMSDLSDQALVTGASTKEISDVFRGMIPNALNAGMTLDQTLKLAGTLTTTGKAMGLNGNILMRDVQDLISGKNVERTKLGALLGITGEDIAQAKQSAGGLFDFLSKRLQGEMQANQKYLESLEGRWNHLKESIARVGGVGLDTTFKAATDEMAAIANQFVKVNNETHQVEFVNPDMIEKVQEAGQVVMNFGGQVKEFANDIKGIAIPALTGLGIGIDFVSQHAAMMGEVLIGTWVARKLNTYVVDYQNAIHGAAEAQTFLGRAVIQTRTQLEEQAVAAEKAALAERQATITAAQQAMQAKLVGTGVTAETAVVAQAMGETQLAAAIRATVAAEAEKVAAVERVQLAFTQANAQLIAGEETVAAGIIANTLSLKEEGAAAELMAERMVQATTAAKMGQFELADSILASTLALDAQGAASIVGGAKVTEGATAGRLAQKELMAVTNGTVGAFSATGTTATIAGEKAVTAGGVALTAVNKLKDAAFALAGGWIGVAIAIGYALTKLYQFAKEQKDWNDKHTVTYNGQQYIVDKDGSIEGIFDYGTPDGPKYTKKISDMPIDTKTAILGIDAQNAQDRAAKDEEETIRKEAEEQKRQQERYLKIQELQANDPDYQNTQKKIAAMMGAVTGKYDSEDSGKKTAAEKAAENAAKEAAHQAQQIAEANHQYAETIKQNAQKIQQANEKISGILASENEKLLKYSGTQLEQDTAKNKKDWADLVKSIHGAAVNLKTLSFTTAQHLAGGNSDQSILTGDYEGLTDGMKNAVAKVLWKAKELGIPDATITSGASGEHAGNSWHYQGLGADIAWSELNWNSPALHELAAYAKSIGIQEVIDDPHGTGPHLHLGNPDEAAQSSSTSPVAGEQAAVSDQIQSNQTQLLAQTDEVKAIIKAAQETNSDASLMLAIAMRETGGDTLNGINMDPNGGMMQITEQSASDYGINDLYSNWRTDMEQNALAGISILNRKIAEQGGDVWAGVKAYNGSGPAADEYLSKVQGNYTSLGANGGMNLAPTSFTRYVPNGTAEALTKASEIEKNANDKAILDWTIRRRKQIEETTQTNDQLSILPNAQEKTIRDKYAAEIAAANDQFKELWQASGKNANDKQTAIDLLAARVKKITYDTNTSLRENLNTQTETWKQHYTNLGYFDDDYQQNVDKNMQERLKIVTDEQKKELADVHLGFSDRVKLEQQYMENLKSLTSTEGKYSISVAWKNQTREIKQYTMDAQSAMKSGWNSITGDMEGAFSNLLTENKSFGERMKNLYISIGNEILNTTMKIIMQGLIMNSVMKAMGSGTSFNFGSVLSSMGISGNVGGTSLGLDTGWSSGLSMVGSFASGGTVPSGYALVGENGAELIYNKTPGYVYNARETSDILGKVANGQGPGASGGAHSVNMTLVNKSGQNLQVSNPSASFNGTKLVASAVIDIVKNNRYGVRTMLKGMV